MSALGLLNPLGWFGGSDGYRAKLSGGPDEAVQAAALESRGRTVSADHALQVSAFWACVRIIAETIATLPLQLFQNDGAGGRSARTDDPLYGLLHDQPNADHTAIEFWEGVVAYLAVGGNAYVRKEYVGPRLVALTLLRAPWMDVRRDRDGLIRYRYTDPVNGMAEYTDEQIMHTRGFGFGDLRGLSALSYARRTLGLALASDEVADATFANGMRMSGWFKYKGGNGILKPEQREQARRLLVDPYVGAGNAAKIGILEGDFDWIAASMPFEDAQLLESRRFGVEDVCRWFGVPPILIGHAAQGQTMWGSGVEQIMLGWLAMGLRPYLVRIEQSIRKHLVAVADRGRVYAEFNVDGLLRADSKARSENYSRLVQNGLYTRNEVRALENMQAVDGGDQLTVQTNLVPIDKLGELASLPRLKPVEPGGDDAAAGGAVEGKFNANHGPDGRFASGDGGGSGHGTHAGPPYPPLTTREKTVLGILGAGVTALAVGYVVHRRTPYKRLDLGPYFSTSGRESIMQDLHRRSVATPLDEAEKASLRLYTGTSYREINRKLRLGHKPSQDILNIDAAIAKASLPDNMVVNRGLNLDRSKRILKTPPGGIIVDRGYPSTSISADIARAFANNKDGAGTSNAAPGKEGYVMSINLDKGTTALPLLKGSMTTPFQIASLQEVLLPRNSAFKVLSVDHDTKTIYMHHLGVATAGSGSKSKTAGLEPRDDQDRLVWDDVHVEIYPPDEDDTTIEDYDGYVPPQPTAAKAYDPNESRDDHGQWSGSGGSSGGGRGGGDAGAPASDWDQVRSIAKTVAVGAALTAAAAIAVALAPEVFALAGGAAAGALAIEEGATAAEAIIAATKVGRLAWVTGIVKGGALSMYQSAALKAGGLALQKFGVDPDEVQRRLQPLVDGYDSLTKAAADKPGDPAALRGLLAETAAQSRDALIGHLGGTQTDPGIAVCRQTIRDAYRDFVARIDTLA